MKIVDKRERQKNKQNKKTKSERNKGVTNIELALSIIFERKRIIRLKHVAVENRNLKI